MKILKIAAVVLVFSHVFTIEYSLSWGQVPEIPRRLMGGIARVTTGRNGQPVIYFNPATCRRLGPDVCAFFRAHEHAHIRLNHLNRPISKRQAEAEADFYAARTASPAAVAAARQWFQAGHGGSRMHGRSWQRANRLSGFGNATSSASSYGPRRSAQRQSGNRNRLFRR